MDKTKVLHTFCTYSKLSEAESTDYDQLIELSMAEASGMLKPDTVLEDDTMLCYLAGVLAFYKYAVIMASTGASEIKVADVTVKNGTSNLLDVAMIAKADAIATCCDILADSFYFAGTAC